MLLVQVEYNSRPFIARTLRGWSLNQLGSHTSLFLGCKPGVSNTRPAGRMWPKRAFCVLLGISKKLTFTLSSALKKDAVEQLNQGWMISSAVFVRAVALHTKFHSPANFWKILEVCKNVCTCFVDLRKHTTGFLVKRFVVECSGSMVLTAACYWPSSHCIPNKNFVSVSGELNHDRWP